MFSLKGDRIILAELGERLRKNRINKQISQEELAIKAGVSRLMIHRIENGGNFNMLNLVRILRVLGLLDQLNLFLPDPGISPLLIAKTISKERKRASRTVK
jgi:putative transcriptional regulator